MSKISHSLGNECCLLGQLQYKIQQIVPGTNFRIWVHHYPEKIQTDILVLEITTNFITVPCNISYREEILDINQELESPLS